MADLDRAVDLDLDGTSYKLSFNFPALLRAEEALAASGRKANLLQAMDIRSMDARQLATLFYAALISARPEITPEAAQGLITMKNFPAILNAVVDAHLKSWLPKGEGRVPEADISNGDD